MSMQPEQEDTAASVRADHPFAPYITYEPTPYDMELTDDPEASRRQFQALSETETEAGT